MTACPLERLVRRAAVAAALAVACALAPGASADAPLAESASYAPFPGCPLSIGQLPVRTWVARRTGALSIRFMPVNRDFAHCLELGALTLVGPGGQALAGQKPAGDWGWLTFAPNGAVPAKVDPVTSTRGFGVGVGLSIPLGDGRAERASSEFVYEFVGIPPETEVGTGWSWVGLARDSCAETEVLLRLPVDRLTPCSNH